MARATFSIQNALNFGWETTKKHFWFLMGVVALAGVLGLGSGITAELTQEGKIDLFAELSLSAISVNIAAVIIQIIISIGMLKIALGLYDKKAVSFSTLFDFSGYFFKYLGTMLLGTVIATLPFVVSLIPAIRDLGTPSYYYVELVLAVIFMLISIRLQYGGYLVVDKALGPIVAIQRSWALTEGHTGRLVLLGLTFIGIVLLGLLALGVGVLVALSVTMLANAFVYRKLLSHRS